MIGKRQHEFVVVEVGQALVCESLVRVGALGTSTARCAQGDRGGRQAVQISGDRRAAAWSGLLERQKVAYLLADLGLRTLNDRRADDLSERGGRVLDRRVGV